jgi:tryptophanyl-tRNA synthetase
MKQEKKRIFSGIQPSGNIHLGNYLGAIKQWVELQNDYDSIFCVVDYHAVTVKQDPKELRKKIIEVAKIYLAAGIDPQKSTIFQQSDVSAHTELAWILNTVARMSDLFRMTQFKDKAGLQADNNLTSEKVNKAGVGLFDYPVLMAADILLYNTDVVPVGEDQLQHVELTCELGRRFNHEFGETFMIPQPKIMKESARIMGLDDPTKKMSKSAKSEYNYIGLTDDPEKAAKKIMRAATDSGSEIKYDVKNKPGISNLLVIYSLLANDSIKNLESKYKGKGYGDFKKDLAEVVRLFLTDFQKKYNMFSSEEVEKIMAEGGKKVKPIADETLEKVKKTIGVK